MRIFLERIWIMGLTPFIIILCSILNGLSGFFYAKETIKDCWINAGKPLW